MNNETSEQMGWGLASGAENGYNVGRKRRRSSGGQEETPYEGERKPASGGTDHRGIPGDRSGGRPAVCPGRLGCGGKLLPLPGSGGGAGGRTAGAGRPRGGHPGGRLPAGGGGRPDCSRGADLWRTGCSGMQRWHCRTPDAAHRSEHRGLAGADGHQSGRGVPCPAGGGPRLCPPAGGEHRHHLLHVGDHRRLLRGGLFRL